MVALATPRNHRKNHKQKIEYLPACFGLVVGLYLLNQIIYLYKQVQPQHSNKDGNKMKHITYKFTDGSEIDIDDNQTATICGNTEQFAYKIWREVTSRKKLPRRLWTAAFIGVADGVHKKHGIILEHTDHFLGKTINNFDNLLSKAI